MRPQDLARLVALGAMWGGSYLFMRVAVPHLGPALMIELRVLLAGLMLAAFMVIAGRKADWRAHWRPWLVVAVIGTALPFMLIAAAVRTIDASTASILNALVPLFTTVVAAIWIRDPITPPKAAGIALSIAGTAVLVGWTPSPMTGKELLAASMSVAATMLYGINIVFSRVRLRGAAPVATSAWTLLLAALVLLPFTPMDRNLESVPGNAWIAVVALAVVSTTVAFIYYYRLIADLGPVKASTVTLLVPVFGMIWGVAFLGEPLTPGRVVGCAIILLGCALILGFVRVPLAVRQARTGTLMNTDETDKSG
ncbi:MAG: DMT family transporter [Usitatibacter sp.]